MAYGQTTIGGASQLFVKRMKMHDIDADNAFIFWCPALPAQKVVELPQHVSAVSFWGLGSL